MFYSCIPKQKPVRGLTNSILLIMFLLRQHLLEEIKILMKSGLMMISLKKMG